MNRLGVKVLLVGAFLFVLTGLLAACGGTYDPNVISQTATNTGSTVSFEVKTIDGRTIPCVSWWWGQAGGISCDWSAR